MVMPLDEKYIHSLHGWAEGVLADQVVTTPHSSARIVLELLNHIQFLQDAVASERYIRMTGSHTLSNVTDETKSVKSLLKRATICPFCLRPKTHHRLYGYRCDTPGHDEMERNLNQSHT